MGQYDKCTARNRTGFQSHIGSNHFLFFSREYCTFYRNFSTKIHHTYGFRYFPMSTLFLQVCLCVGAGMCVKEDMDVSVHVSWTVGSGRLSLHMNQVKVIENQSHWVLKSGWNSRVSTPHCPLPTANCSGVLSVELWAWRLKGDLRFVWPRAAVFELATWSSGVVIERKACPVFDKFD